jgi:Flp pilus assembly protein TadD
VGGPQAGIWFCVDSANRLTPALLLPRLKKAAALDPKALEPRMFLAEACGQLGRKTDAARERTAAKRLGMSDQ